MGAPKGHVKYGGGRQIGTPNKVTADIKLLARAHGPDVIARLLTLAHDPSGAVSVAASKELLDRGYGKAIQPIAGSAEGDPIKLENKTVIILPSNGRDGGV